eukprot:5245170-Amphidinium_carterae.1
MSLSTSSCEPDQSEDEEEIEISEEEFRSQDFIGMLNFRGRDDDSFSLVDQWSSRSPSSDESDSQGRDVSQTPHRQPDESQPDQNQPEVTRFYVRSHQRTLPDGRVITIRRHSRTRGRAGKSKGKGKGKSGKDKRITSQVSSGDEQVAESRPVTVNSEDQSSVFRVAVRVSCTHRLRSAPRIHCWHSHRLRPRSDQDQSVWSMSTSPFWFNRQ